MQIEIMDRIAFSVVSKTCVKELVKEHPEWDGRIIKHNAKSRFKKMLQETPSIGSLEKTEHVHPVEAAKTVRQEGVIAAKKA